MSSVFENKNKNYGHPISGRRNFLKSEQLLQYIRKAAEIRKIKLKAYQKTQHDIAIIQALEMQFFQYHSIFANASTELVALGFEPRNVNGIIRITAAVRAKAAPFSPPSSAHSAARLIRRGAAELLKDSRCIDRYSENNRRILELANTLKKTDERTIETFMKFL